MTDAGIVLYLFFSFIAFLICLMIAKWVFQINDLIEYQHKQYRMLRQIASKLGVEQDRIDEIDNPEHFYKMQRKHIKAAAKEAKKVNKDGKII